MTDWFLASYLVNLYDEDLSSNMESDTEVNMCDFIRLVVMRKQSDRSGDDEKYFFISFFFFSLVQIDGI